jgi:hypothetical protein
VAGTARRWSSEAALILIFRSVMRNASVSIFPKRRWLFSKTPAIGPMPTIPKESPQFCCHFLSQHYQMAAGPSNAAAHWESNERNRLEAPAFCAHRRNGPMVSDDDFELQLRFVRRHAAGHVAGVLGPDSVT